MKFTLDDQEYDLDLDKLTAGELGYVYENTQLGLWSFGRGVLDGHPGALRAVVILAKRRAGEKARWQDFDGLELYPLAAQMQADLLRGAEAALASLAEDGAEADPTQPAPEPASEADGTSTTRSSNGGKSRKRASAAT